MPPGKASAYNVGDPGSIPGSGRSPGEGKGNELQYPCLENPMKGGASLATVHGVAKSPTQLSDFTFFFEQEHLFLLLRSQLSVTLTLMPLVACVMQLGTISLDLHFIYPACDLLCFLNLRAWFSFWKRHLQSAFSLLLLDK